MNWRVLAASGILLAGQSGTSRAAERPWIEVRSANFRVLSDADERAARGVALRFEQIRGAFASFAPGLRLDPGAPLVVIAARDEKSLAMLLPSFFESKGGARPAGVFIPGENRVFVVLREDVDDASESRHSVLFHEYVHLLQALNYRTLPLWLSEGMAEFYAHTTIQENRVLIGRAAPWHLALLRHRRLMPFAEFFAVGRDSSYYNEGERASLFYAQAWAVTHWLIMGDKRANLPRLRKFLARLDEGVAPAEAVVEALGSADELRRILDTYVSQPGFFMQPVPAAAADSPTFASRAVPPGEIAAWRALVHLQMGRAKEARQAADESLRLAPDEALGHEATALLLTREVRLPEARAAAAEAVKRDPKSMPALMLAGTLALMPGGAGPAEAVKSFEAAGALAPQHALVPFALADARTRAGAPSEETLRLAQRAVELAPSALRFRFMLASQLLRHGDQQAAQLEAERALALATTDEEKAAGRLVLEGIKALPRPADAMAARPAREVGKGADQDLPRALALLREACEQGNAAACVRAGFMLEKGDGAPPDVETATLLYRKGCDGDDQHGCYDLGLVQRYAKGVARNVAGARVSFEKACAKGHGAACYELGGMAWNGDGMAKDESGAADFYDKSCAAKDPAGCRALAWHYTNGRGRPADAERAVALYRQACDGEDARGCDGLGWAYANGRGTGKDLKRAIELFDKACTKDPPTGCVSLGEWLERPEVGRDFARAAIAYEKGCQGDDQGGCASLARLYHWGFGVAMDTAKAETLARSACEKDAESCDTLAWIFLEKSPAKAVMPLGRACDAKTFEACTELGILHAGGRGVPLSVAKAVPLLEKACAGGDGRGCKVLADLIEFGTAGGAPNPTRAAALKKKACAAGYEPACRKP